MVSLLGGRNAIVGTIPTELAGMTALENIFLDSNTGITGTFPTFFSSMPNIERVFLNNTQVNGTLPVELYSQTTLQELHLQFSQVGGDGATISTLIGNLTNLRNLNLEVRESIAGQNSPRIQGTLPTEFGELSLLQSLNLGNHESK